jgi:hypothetical protein
MEIVSSASSIKNIEGGLYAALMDYFSSQKVLTTDRDQNDTFASRLPFFFFSVRRAMNGAGT